MTWILIGIANVIVGLALDMALDGTAYLDFDVVHYQEFLGGNLFHLVNSSCLIVIGLTRCVIDSSRALRISALSFAIGNVLSLGPYYLMFATQDLSVLRFAQIPGVVLLNIGWGALAYSAIVLPRAETLANDGARLDRFGFR
jgi:hypothetical protein